MINKRGSSIAVRSDSIIEARFSLTAKQNELLDMLLCEIKDDEQSKYVISVDKYKEFYQTDTSNLYRDLRKAVKGFEGKGFRIINKANKEEIYYAWFSKIHYIPKSGEIHVNIDLDFKRLLWEVKKKIYYDVRYTLNFNSGYSQRMYYYLKSFEDTGWRIDTVENLLYKLECPPSYKNFADFKRAVLDVAEKEINATSDITFFYETKKTGRKITHIKFFIKNKNKKEVTDKNTQLIFKVKDIIKENISDDDIVALLKASNDEIGIIEEKYNLMKRQKYVVDIVAWLKDAIKKDYKPRASYQQTSVFNDYEQRNYNFKNLEKKLLGWDTGDESIYKDTPFEKAQT